MSQPSLIVLLVEDEAAHAELIRRAFEPDPAIRLEVEPSLAKAEAKLSAGLPDLLLIDSSLPDGRGLDLLSHLDHGPRLGTIPTVLLTSHHEPRLEKEAREAGIFHYLVKTPENLFEMSSRIRRILDDWRHRHSNLS